MWSNLAAFRDLRNRSEGRHAACFGHGGGFGIFWHLGCPTAAAPVRVSSGLHTQFYVRGSPPCGPWSCTRHLSKKYHPSQSLLAPPTSKLSPPGAQATVGLFADILDISSKDLRSASALLDTWSSPRNAKSSLVFICRGMFLDGHYTDDVSGFV